MNLVIGRVGLGAKLIDRRRSLISEQVTETPGHVRIMGHGQGQPLSVRLLHVVSDAALQGASLLAAVVCEYAHSMNTPCSGRRSRCTSGGAGMIS